MLLDHDTGHLEPKRRHCCSRPAQSPARHRRDPTRPHRGKDRDLRPLHRLLPRLPGRRTRARRTRRPHPQRLGNAGPVPRPRHPAAPRAGGRTAANARGARPDQDRGRRLPPTRPPTPTCKSPRSTPSASSSSTPTTLPTRCTPTWSTRGSACSRTATRTTTSAERPVLDRTGQERAIAFLRQPPRRPHHAYLLAGPEGGGKQLAARAFAAALLCNRGGCGECRDCRLALEDNHPNEVLVEPEGRDIHVDTVRAEIWHPAYRTAPEPGRKVFVIREADRLNPAAADVLLKVLEEPPADAVLMLLSARPHELPETVLSRCHLVSFRPLAEDFVVRALVADGADASRAALAARLSGGNLGRARRIATDEDGLAFRDVARQALEPPPRGPAGAIEAADRLLAAARAQERPRRAPEGRARPVPSTRRAGRRTPTAARSNGCRPAPRAAAPARRARLRRPGAPRDLRATPRPDRGRRRRRAGALDQPRPSAARDGRPQGPRPRSPPPRTRGQPSPRSSTSTSASSSNKHSSGSARSPPPERRRSATSGGNGGRDGALGSAPKDVAVAPQPWCWHHCRSPGPVPRWSTEEQRG